VKTIQLTVVSQLKKNNDLEFVGGPYFVSTLTNEAKFATLEFNCKVVAQMFLKREVIRISTNAIKEAYEDSSDVFEILSQNELNIQNLTTSVQISHTFTGVDCSIELDLHLKAISNLKENQLIGVDTGFKELNQYTGGWNKSDLIILAARPAMGKTSLMLNFIQKAMNEFVLVFSLEMSKLQLFARMTSQVTEISLDRFLKEQMAFGEKTIYEENKKKLSNSKLLIDDRGGVDLNYIKIKARKLKRTHGIKAIFIDYLQLIKLENSNKSTNDLVGKISAGLKALAKELDLPIIVLSQLNREVENKAGTDKRPRLHHLRDSGNLEQDADMVIFVHRSEYYGITEDETGNTTIGQAELIIAKHRNGALGTVKCRFDGSCTNFYDINEPTLTISSQADFKVMQANDNFLDNTEPPF
jgi:replicative DNA helicase